jgi:hypothetical protein
MFFAWWPPTLECSSFWASPWGRWPSAKGLAFLIHVLVAMFRPYAALRESRSLAIDRRHSESLPFALEYRGSSGRPLAPARTTVQRLCAVARAVALYSTLCPEILRVYSEA